jgi:hypothetical protein
VRNGYKTVLRPFKRKPLMRKRNLGIRFILRHLFYPKGKLEASGARVVKGS